MASQKDIELARISRVRSTSSTEVRTTDSPAHESGYDHAGHRSPVNRGSNQPGMEVDALRPHSPESNSETQEERQNQQGAASCDTAEQAHSATRAEANSDLSHRVARLNLIAQGIRQEPPIPDSNGYDNFEAAFQAAYQSVESLQIFTPSGHEIGMHARAWMLEPSTPFVDPPSPFVRRRRTVDFLRRRVTTGNARNADALRARDLNREAHSKYGNTGKPRYPNKKQGKGKRGRELEERWDKRQEQEDEYDGWSYDREAPSTSAAGSAYQKGKGKATEKEPECEEKKDERIVVNADWFELSELEQAKLICNWTLKRQQVCFFSLELFMDFINDEYTFNTDIEFSFLRTVGYDKEENEVQREFPLYRQCFSGLYHDSWKGIFYEPIAEMHPKGHRFFYTTRPRHGTFHPATSREVKTTEEEESGVDIFTKTKSKNTTIEQIPSWYVPSPPTFIFITPLDEWEPLTLVNLKALHPKWPEYHTIVPFGKIRLKKQWEATTHDHRALLRRAAVAMREKILVKNKRDLRWEKEKLPRDAVCNGCYSGSQYPVPYDLPTKFPYLFACPCTMDNYYLDFDGRPIPHNPYRYLYTEVSKDKKPELEALFLNDSPAKYSDTADIREMLKTKDGSRNWPLVRGLVDVFFNPSAGKIPEAYKFTDVPLERKPVLTVDPPRPVSKEEMQARKAKRSDDPNPNLWEPHVEQRDNRPVNFRHGKITHIENVVTVKVTKTGAVTPREHYHNSRRKGKGIIDSLRALGASDRLQSGAIPSNDAVFLNVETNLAQDLLTSRVTPQSVLNNPREIASRMERFVNSASHINSDHKEFLMQNTTLYAQLLATRQYNKSMVVSGTFRKQVFQEGPPPS